MERGIVGDLAEMGCGAFVPEMLQGLGRFAFDVFHAAKEDDVDLAAGEGQVAGGDKAIPAIIAFAAENDYPVGAAVAGEAEARDGCTGVLHEHGNGCAEFLGAAGGGGHVGCGENLHLSVLLEVRLRDKTKRPGECRTAWLRSD
ncbi:MAG: hypothetical protein NVSMB62_13930 [Acidobacteriaceae bacterium]